MAPQLTILQRVENLERKTNEVSSKLDGVFEQFRSSLGASMEVIEGLIGVVQDMRPPDVSVIQLVQDKVEASRAAKREAKMEQEKQQVAQLVETGVLKVTDTITERSFLVGRSFDPAGNIAGLPRQQFEFSQLHPDVKAKFLGQGPGFSFASETGEKLEILEVYEIVQQEEVKTVPTLVAAPEGTAEVTEPKEV